MDHFAEWMVQHRFTIGVALFVLGLGASILLAFAASSESPPNGAQSALLVIVGGLLNLGGAWAVSRRPGGPNLTATRMVIRHLAAIGTRVVEVKVLAENAFDARPGGKAREDVGEISAKLSDIEDRLITNLEDWASAYPDLVEKKPDAIQADAKDAKS